MTTLRLYNTLTKQKDDFAPLDAKNVRMYVCGPTVYDYAHIGNARPAIVFDVLFRLLRHIYGESHVTYVRNITDIDDKINKRAAERAATDKRNVPILQVLREITEATYGVYRDDVTALGCLPPTHMPRATEYVPQMIAMIEKLIAAGYAYPAQGHVLFRVHKKADYGKLARRSLDDMLAGARIDVAPYKEDAMDFVLWKPSEPEQPGWQSPWGYGRPGWHLECSAMIEATFKFDEGGDTIDIHGGGNDLIFPHHENEIAQSEGAHHDHPLARYWVHNGFLNVEGEKMSKSLGNFVTINQLLREWHGVSWPGEALRFNMLQTHYRQPMDWTYNALDESHKTLWDWAGALEQHQNEISDVPSSIVAALADDLNTPKMIAELHVLRRSGDLSGLLAALRFLGFTGKRENLTRSTTVRLVGIESTAVVGQPTALNHSEIDQLILARKAARAAKDFKESDRIRDDLLAKGIVLKDGPTGTTWEVKR